jgi:hypothetical protein
MPLRGRRRAQISGSAFQTSAGLFLGFDEALPAAAEEGRAEVRSECPMRGAKPGPLGTISFRCGDSG